MLAPHRGALALLGALGLSVPAAAQTPLTTVRIVEGLSLPTWVGAPAGDDRLFVCEQNSARVKVVKDGVVGLLPFLDLGASASQGGERGLVGMVFHPDYAENGYFYVAYIDNANVTKVSRFEVSAGNPDIADAGSEFVILEVPQTFDQHNGGGMMFGPNGYLWLGFGDGGGLDPICNGQNPTTLHGKMLRIDVDGGSPYAIPPDNPWAGGGPWPPETWSVGWRNPWRFTVDPATGDLYVGDVGEVTREEISYEPAGTPGRNYGWYPIEGDVCNGLGACPGTTPGCASGVYTMPVHVYDHFTGCAVIGGHVYRGCGIPDLQGTYFFGDFCANRIWSFEMVGGAVTNFTDRTAELDPGGGLAIGTVSSFGLDGDGELLIVDYAGGEIFQVVPAASAGADCDGNGLADACEVVANPLSDIDGSGTPDACEGLTADANEVSVATGGTVNLGLFGGGGVAGHAYLVLGSASGTTPAFPIDGFFLPLNVFDAYFNYTLANANGPVLQGSFGFLDLAGEAGAQLVFPVLGAGSVGLTLHHAWASFDAFGSGEVSAVSQALPLSITP